MLRKCFNVETRGYSATVRMVKRCAVPGCTTLGLGRLCIKHEPKLTRVFVRGRPWPPPEANELAPVTADPVLPRAKALLAPAAQPVAQALH